MPLRLRLWGRLTLLRALAPGRSQVDPGHHPDCVGCDRLALTWTWTGDELGWTPWCVLFDVPEVDA